MSFQLYMILKWKKKNSVYRWNKIFNTTLNFTGYIYHNLMTIEIVSSFIFAK